MNIKILKVISLILLLLALSGCMDTEEIEQDGIATDYIHSICQTTKQNTYSNVLKEYLYTYEEAIEEILVPAYQSEEYYLRDKLVKWNSDIIIRLRGEYHQEDKQNVKKIIKQLSKLENLPKIKLYNGEEASNFNLTFGSNSYIQDHCFQSICNGKQMVVLVSNDFKTIEMARGMVVNQYNVTSQYKATLRAIIEGLGFGRYISKTDKITTVFNPYSTIKSLSEFDRIALEMFYDNGIKKGMISKESLDIFYFLLKRNYSFTTTTTTTTTTIFSTNTTASAFTSISESEISSNITSATIVPEETISTTLAGKTESVVSDSISSSTVPETTTVTSIDTKATKNNNEANSIASVSFKTANSLEYTVK